MTGDDLDPRLAGALLDYSRGGVRPIDATATAHAAAVRAASLSGLTAAARRSASGLRRQLAPTGRVAFAAAAVAVVAVVGYSLADRGTAGEGGSSVPPPASVRPSPTPTATPATTPQPSPLVRQLEPGEYEIPWTPAEATIRFTVPDGWSTDETGAHLFMTKGAGPWGPSDPGLPDLIIHDVKSVVPEICSSGDPAMAPVGPSADDLVAALADQAGWVEKSDAVDVELGGYPARKVVGRLPGACAEPAEGVTIWANTDGTVYVPLEGSEGLTTIYVVDVNGRRLVITAGGYRSATADDIAERDAILATIRIERGIPLGVNAPLHPDAPAGPGYLGPGLRFVDVSGRSRSFTLPPGGETQWD